MVIAAALSITVLVGCTAVSKSSNEVISLVESGDFQQAKKALDGLANNESFTNDEKNKVTSKIETELSLELDSLTEKFKNDEINVKEMNETLSGYESLRLDELSKKVKETKDTLKGLIFSRESFAKAEENFKNKNFRNAIDEYLRVVKDDSKYKQAQDNINLATSELLTEVKDEVGTKKNSYEILSYLRNYEKYLKDDESFNTLLKENEKKYYDESINNIKGLIANKDYDKAISELETVKSLTKPTDEIEKLLKEVNDIQKKLKTERINQLLATMNRKYDSMTDMTRIAPKGVNPFSLDIPQGGYVFLPIITFSGQDIEDGIAAIGIATGFSQDDWIFMKNIKFNVDGDRFEWRLSYGEAETEVGWGAIYEWVLLNNLTHSNLKSDLQKITNAKSVTIRFDGDVYSRDETLSSNQLQRIKDALELYELINKYGL